MENRPAEQEISLASVIATTVVTLALPWAGYKASIVDAEHYAEQGDTGQKEGGQNDAKSEDGEQKDGGHTVQ